MEMQWKSCTNVFFALVPDGAFLQNYLNLSLRYHEMILEELYLGSAEKRKAKMVDRMESRRIEGLYTAYPDNL